MDAPHYNEMLVNVLVIEYLGCHSSSSSSDKNDDKLKVLVVGGGDGYVVSKLLKHPQIKSIHHVKLDHGVIHVSKEHLPWGDAWKDEKVNLINGDGVAYVNKQTNKGESYHVIVQDTSNPFWLDKDGGVTTLPSSMLYDILPFELLYKLLWPKEGVLMFQDNIPSYLESIRMWRGLLVDIGFRNPRYGSISFCTYWTGQIGFFAIHA